MSLPEELESPEDVVDPRPAFNGRAADASEALGVGSLA